MGQAIATVRLWASFEPWALTVLLGAKGRSVRVPAGGSRQSGAVLTWASTTDAEGEIRAANYLSAVKEAINEVGTRAGMGTWCSTC